MTFNGIDFKTLLKVEEVRRSILPPVVVESHEVPGMHGSKFNRVTFDNKEIEVDIRLIEESRSEVQTKARDLAYKLYTDKPAKLYLPDEPDKYNMAILSGDTNLEKILYTGGATLVFLCNDPIAFGETKSSSFSDLASLVIGGTYKTKPVFSFEFTAPCSTVKMINLTSGKLVEIKHEFETGDVLEVDFSDKWKARKNGVVIAKDISIISNFFHLEVGTNEMKVEPTTQICTMRYIERWL